jgi:hypothetical protein
MKLVCPECGSQEITFGKDFLQYRYWQQVANEPLYYFDFEYGDDSEEFEDAPVSASCRDCNYCWDIKGSVDDYMDG